MTLFAALMNFSSILAFAGRVVELLLPIIAGGILALSINVPVRGIEKRSKKLFAKKKTALGQADRRHKLFPHHGVRRARAGASIYSLRGPGRCPGRREGEAHAALSDAPKAAEGPGDGADGGEESREE